MNYETCGHRSRRAPEDPADGVIVRPDTPLVPDTATYVRDASGKNGPMVATTVTRHGELTAGYVYAYARDVPTPEPAAFYEAEDATPSGPQVGTGHPGPSGSGYVDFQHTAPVTRDGSYLQVVTVGRSGIAFLGDAGKFVSLGRQRIAELSDDGTVRATIAYADGEGPVTLHGYSPADVSVSATGGRAGDVTYDFSTRRFSVPITPYEGSSSVRGEIAR
ncbi:hypothetical protein [Streptomyces sp. 46]|uniref:hypothetical protein n=1 Tax=Streptomyces sp. 46 TaxID=1777322 RepID=UPI00131E3698|nr:hypothetical protein [Streptomyces sp. 46]